MMDAGDLSPLVEDDAELREADTVRQTRSSSRASQQQTTDGAGPSIVLVADGVSLLHRVVSLPQLYLPGILV